MQIKEIELDLPYQENYDYIEKIIRENGLSNEEANSKDYIDNWKEKRLKFRLDTRCMTSMIERLTFPVKSMSFWKIMTPEQRKKSAEETKKAKKLTTT